MSRAGEIALDFGGEERSFRLGIGQWRKVQEKCDAGPAEILARLAPIFAAKQAGLTMQQIMAHGYLGAWRVDDLREVILQGLLGANMAGPDALRLVRDWVEERPMLESVAVAYAIVLASVAGTEDEAAVGEPEAAEADNPISPAASSGSGKMASMPSAPPAASAQETLTP